MIRKSLRREQLTFLKIVICLPERRRLVTYEVPILSFLRNGGKFVAAGWASD
jgi:hypothetical protein